MKRELWGQYGEEGATGRMPFKDQRKRETGIHCEILETLFRVSCYWQMGMYIHFSKSGFH
jgi:hypothetical protein